MAALQKKLNAMRSMVFMGAGDDEAQESLKKEIEELKRQIAIKEMEYKRLQDEVTLVRTVLQLVSAKSTPPPSPVVDSTHKVAELLAKLIGCVGSLFTGTMFVVSWWKKRREAAQNATS